VAYQQQQPVIQQPEQPPEQQFQPTLDAEKTRRWIKVYQETPSKVSEEQLEDLRKHAQYHNVPFYEGDFSIMEAIKQAGGGFIEGFTTLRVADPPDNEYEAVARSLGHLIGFVPGILSGPLKSIGLIKQANQMAGLKSIPMLAADYVTKGAKKIVTPALKGAMNSRFKAADAASSFFLKEKSAHIVEGAFHLGTASAISSVWDGVDQMWESFKGGAIAGGVFRTLGNVIPGTESGDKFVRGLAGSMFLGLPATARGATTPEQIYEYLIGAYFGAGERPWYVAKASKGMKEFDKQSQTSPKLEAEKNVEDMEGWGDYPEIVQKEMNRMAEKAWGSKDNRLHTAHFLMDLFGITDKIPAEERTTTGYKMLHSYTRGQQKRTKYKTHKELGIGVSGAAKGADATWGKEGHKVGYSVLHMIPETSYNTRPMQRFFEQRDRGEQKGVPRGVSEAELMEAGPAVEQANHTLGRPIEKIKRESYDFILRNWFQVKNANSLFAVGELETSHPTLNYRAVKGGTGWAVQMALDKGMQDVFVYDQRQGSWFQWSTDANQFKAIKGTPKLKANPALIGTRELNPLGKKAIQDVMQLTFGDKTTGEPSQIKEAVDPSTIKKYHVETIRNINNLRDSISEKKQDIKDNNVLIKTKKIGKVKIKRLQKENVELQKQIDEMYKEIINTHQTLEPTQYVDIHTGEIVNDIDTGMAAQDFSLMQKSEYFSNIHLKDLWEKEDTIYSKRDRMLEYGKQTETILRAHQVRGSKETKSEEAIKDLEEAFGTDSKPYKLKPPARQAVKKWLRELNLGKQVIFVKTRGGSKIDFTKPGRPTSSSGLAIRQVEPPKLIEDIYTAEGGENKKGGAPMVIFDRVTRTKKNGMSIDVPLEKLVTHFRFTENMSEADAIKKADNLKGNIIRHLMKENNLYPLGGQGDKGRIVFVKVHPNSRKETQYTKTYNQLIKSLKKRKKGRFYTDKDAATQLNRDKALMKKRFGITDNEFKQMVASNVLYDLSLNGYELTPKNLDKLMGPGFIPSAIQFNKRNQIWMTNGYGGDKEFFKNAKDDMGNVILNDLSVRGNFLIRLINDPDTPDNLKKRALLAISTELPEHIDGAILVRDDVLELINQDAGNPDVNSQNKSFIVDNTPQEGPNFVWKMSKKAGNKMVKVPLHPNQYMKNMGALLGKYMMHSAGEKASAEMKKEGVHMMLMTSAAKQTGERIAGDYEVKGGLKFIGGEKYELDPSSIKYNTSVVNNKHMTEPQIWVKQLFTNLHQYGKAPISEEIIEDINQEVIQKSFNGKKEVNEALQSYLNTFDNSKIDYLLRHLEEIGTRDLIKALKSPGAERFSERAMQQMLRIVEKDIEAQFQEGEITAEQRAATLQNLSEAISPIDRLLKNIAVVGEEAAAEGIPGYSGYLHKYVRDYRAAVLHNYFVKSVTRPTMDNSSVARMRPYDKWMQEEFPELNNDKLAKDKFGVKSDELFYLDEAYRKQMIKLPTEDISLEDLWAKKDNPAYKNSAKRVFDALVLRVPMDSISGAHKLKFAGFTGRKGHGIMLHSRAMRALGGADLDGDEAFIYFGGKTEDGRGYGMKQSWLDAIHANKGEYYNKNKTDVKDNKKEFRKLLTKGSGDDNPLKTKKSLYYSPYSRLAASEGATQGRGMLGVAVVQGQVMKSAYNSIMGADSKTDVFVTDVHKKGRFRITLKPKTGSKAREYQRELTRAQIAFASDPLDEAGLKGPEVFFKTMHDAYFDMSVEKKNPKTKRFQPYKGPVDFLKPTHLKQGIIGAYYNMNRGYFSKNYEEGRRYTMDEVNHLANSIRNLDESQKNTILPKLVETLQGLDWSDNLFNRIDRVAIENTYAEIKEMVVGKDTKFGDWLKKAMGRVSFKVDYNAQIDTVVINKLYDRTIRHKIAKDSSPSGLKEFLRIVQNSVFGKEFKITDKRLKSLYKYDERLRVLEQMHRQAEDFLSNDIASMATLLNIKRILDAHRINPKTIAKIHRKVEAFKARSYLARKERRQMDYDAYLGSKDEVESVKLVNAYEEIIDKHLGISKKAKDLIGDKRSASYDQFQMDEKIRIYKNTLKNDAERELFDHLFIGTLNRGELNKIKRLFDTLKTEKRTPFLRDLLGKLIKEASRTTQSRLAINSEQISDIAIQNHFKSMNHLHVGMSKDMTKDEASTAKSRAEEILDSVKPNEPDVVDDLVQGALKGEGYAGIKEGDLIESDKKLITDIAVILKRYNKKVGNNLPDLNQQIRGITATMDPQMVGKDLNTLNRQDFENIRRYLQDIEGGTFLDKLLNSKSPEIQKRYWHFFPETTNRSMMRHDILWLQKKGYFIARGGKIKEGTVARPTYFLEMLQDVISRNNAIGTGKAEVLAKEIEDEFNHLTELKEGKALFDIAVAQMELGNKKLINKDTEEHESIKNNWRQVYDILKNDKENEHNWPKLQKKEFTVLNDSNKRITATGREIVNGSKKKELTGIKKRIGKKFQEMHRLIVGDEKAFHRYTTGKYFDPENKLQPIMNWQKFVMDMYKALEKGDTIPMELGIDGMRHIMRSMMVDLGGKDANYHEWTIKPTGKLPFDTYWPHMFFDKATAERSMKLHIEKIRKDKTLDSEQKLKAIEKLAIRHRTITGDWEFADMQDWDKVDVFEMQEAHKRIAAKKEKSEESPRWTDMNPTFASMHSRKSHIPGWSTDMNVMQVYAKNLANTYYRQISHLMSRKILDEAYHRMNKKFGKELAGRWDKFFKLYVQGAMGQPDIIPAEWYNDPGMKLKGTPYAWFADNHVLDRVNKIRESLGIRESDLPKKLKDFDYNDIRHWSNMEAKFELATLLAHPKTAITNIFGGSMHTIQSVGPGALVKARSIKFLKRIFPEWTSLQDADDFVVRKGVLPEFMIHELGLGRDAKGLVGIENFIGELSAKINSKDPIARKEISSLGKKHGISDSIVAKAAKFMSVPERILRRDAFMAHYIRAWERFGGAIKDPEHPFLIEIAKKGVKATQFLYEAPFRPFFARTALGKVMTRFQLYAWNSWRFRNEVIRQAKFYGFKQGTEAYNRFTRTAQIDLFVLALGNMFIYSLFDNALPQPWGWFQDTSEWLFGDEKERNRAFFGSYPTAIAPLQLITPPLARFPVSSLMQWSRDDYTRFTDYQVYTLFPFGRMIRDIAQPGKGLIENPSRLLEKLAGMPIRDLQKYSTQRKKDIEEGIRWKQPRIGGF
jgi:hypothetical protein